MNKKYLCIALALLSCAVSTSFAANQVSVEIRGRGLIIGTPDAVSVNLGDVQAGSSVSYTFTNNFWIKDLRGIEQGHYTTIQCDGLFQQGGTGVITGVMLKSTAGVLLGGQANQTTINSGLQLGDGLDITQPKLYFYRNDGGNNGGVLNTYGDKPIIKISIPEGTPTGTYKGKITYTLYDMPFTISE